mmetsp:Transcript_43299/g.105961  ORF Transcript_43299/g.105961 Transcript_43299/m.105961 type:complete len:211 (-) Transcript_43299:391-1023(-)
MGASEGGSCEFGVSCWSLEEVVLQESTDTLRTVFSMSVSEALPPCSSPSPSSSRNSSMASSGPPCTTSCLTMLLLLGPHCIFWRIASNRSVRSNDSAVASLAGASSISSILHCSVRIVFSTDAIFLWGHRAIPCLLQIFLIALVHIPRASPASLIETPKYLVSSSYQRGRVHALKSPSMPSGMLISRHIVRITLSICAYSPMPSSAKRLR